MPTCPLDALGALGDPTRRAIVELLAARPRAVGELAAELPVSRPAVSQHLKVLKQVSRDYLDQLWDTALAGFTSAVERDEE